MSFDKLNESWNHHCNQDIAFPFYTFVLTPLLLAQLVATCSDCCPCHFDFYRMSYKWNQTVCSSLCLASFTWRNAFETHSCCCIYEWFFPFHCSVILCLSIHSVVDIQSILAIINKAAINTSWSFYRHMFIIFLCKYLGVGLLENMGSKIHGVLNFIRSWFSKVAVPSCTPSTTVGGSQGLLTLVSTWCWYLAILVGFVVASHCGLTLHFPDGY